LFLRKTPQREIKVTRIPAFWARVRPHRAQLGLTVRVTVAAMLALAAAQFMKLPLPLWAILTAIIVTQLSVGKSLKATIDYLSGTFGGAVYGAVIAVFVPHGTELTLMAVLALAVAPLTLIAAMKPSLTVAPITAVIVILIPGMIHVSAVVSAYDRLLEVAIGGFIGFVVSFLILPTNAHSLAIEAAARTLDHMAQAFGELLAGVSQGLDKDALHRIQDHIGHSLVQLDTIGGEAERERSARLVAEPNTRPLLSILLRLRHDLVMIGRVALEPLPEPFQARLRLPLGQIEAAVATYLRASGVALMKRRGPPSLSGVESALATYAAEVAALRDEGLTRSLSGDAVERFFALGFALEQMHQNFRELEHLVKEWADVPMRTFRIMPDKAAD
jgi:uncharacterized membrane protein YccC